MKPTITSRELQMGAVTPLGDRNIVETGGAKLGRVWHHMQSTSFVILSAFRGEFSPEENLSRNAQMINDFRAHGLGGIQLVGHFVEKDAEGNAHKVAERSFMIPLTAKAKNSDGSQMEAADLLDLAVEIGRKYDQEAILYGDERGIYAYDCKTKEAFHIGDTKTLDQSNLGDYYSQVKKRLFKFGFKEDASFVPFVLEGEVFPRNHAEGMAMENLGLYV